MLSIVVLSTASVPELYIPPAPWAPPPRMIVSLTSILPWLRIPPASKTA